MPEGCIAYTPVNTCWTNQHVIWVRHSVNKSTKTHNIRRIKVNRENSHTSQIKPCSGSVISHQKPVLSCCPSYCVFVLGCGPETVVWSQVDTANVEVISESSRSLVEEQREFTVHEKVVVDGGQSSAQLELRSLVAQIHSSSQGQVIIASGVKWVLGFRGREASTVWYTEIWFCVLFRFPYFLKYVKDYDPCELCVSEEFKKTLHFQIHLNCMHLCI